MITEAQLIERIRIVAATEPDFVYDNNRGSCTYLPSGNVTCGCLVGEALLDLGIDRGLLQIVDDWAEQGISVNWGSDPLVDLLGKETQFEHAALVSPWVKQAQIAQDGDQSWGEAIVTADRVAAENGWGRG